MYDTYPLHIFITIKTVHNGFSEWPLTNTL
jgi:hypothetical protein